jgi:general secretion pathway protein D
VQASARQGNNNLLSLPSILTNDNQYAEISVGQEVPFSTSTLSGGGNSQQSLGGYAEALITLGISPHISEDEYLRLSVELTVDSFNGEPPQVGLPPPRSTRALSAVITVPNRSTVVIGGLRQTNDAKTVTKVPVLGDIPILGALFRRRSTTKQETTLYLFITPQILGEAGFGDLLDVTRVKETEVERLIGDRIVLIDTEYGKERPEPVPVGSRRDAQIDSLMDQLPEMPYYRSPSDEDEPTPAAPKESAPPATEESSAAPSVPARGTVADRSK